MVPETIILTFCLGNTEIALGRNSRVFYIPASGDCGEVSRVTHRQELIWSVNGVSRPDVETIGNMLVTELVFPLW